MAKMAKIEGVSQLLANLQKAHDAILKKQNAKMLKAAIFLLRESQAIVPVQMGNLKASGFVRNAGSVINPDYIIGYTAEYAIFVHENLDAAHGQAFNLKHAVEIAHAEAMGLKSATASGGMFRRGETQQAKFLEKPLRENRKKIFKMLS